MTVGQPAEYQDPEPVKGKERATVDFIDTFAFHNAEMEKAFHRHHDMFMTYT